MTILTFNQINLTPVSHNDGQIWLTSAELAKALGYKNSKSVTNLYNANADEFTSNMTTVIESVTSSKIKGLTAKIRIFSLRGCHLLAMFARTKVAKEFRKWVLDILDKEVGNPVVTTTTKDDRTPLKNAVNMLIGKTNLNYSEAYRMVHQYMGVHHIDEIAKEDLPQAVEYVHRLTVQAGQKVPQNPNYDPEYGEKRRLVGQATNLAVMKITEDLVNELGEIKEKLVKVRGLAGVSHESFIECKHGINLSWERQLEVRRQAQDLIDDLRIKAK